MRVPHRTVETQLLIGRNLCDARREAARARLRVVVSSGLPGWSAELPDALRVVGQEPPPHMPIRRRLPPCAPRRCCRPVLGGSQDLHPPSHQLTSVARNAVDDVKNSVPEAEHRSDLDLTVSHDASWAE